MSEPVRTVEETTQPIPSTPSPPRQLTQEELEVQELCDLVDNAHPPESPIEPLGFGLPESYNLAEILNPPSDDDASGEHEGRWPHVGEIVGLGESHGMYSSNVYGDAAEQTPAFATDVQDDEYWRKIFVLNCAPVQDIFAGNPDYERWQKQSAEEDVEDAPDSSSEDCDLMLSADEAEDEPQEPEERLEEDAAEAEEDEVEDEDEEDIPVTPFKAFNGNRGRRRRRDEEDDDYVDHRAENGSRRPLKKSRLSNMRNPNKPRRNQLQNPRQIIVDPNPACPSPGCSVTFDVTTSDYNALADHFLRAHDLAAFCDGYASYVPCPLGNCNSNKADESFVQAHALYKNIGRHLWHTHMNCIRWQCPDCSKIFSRKDAAKRHMGSPTRCQQDVENVAQEASSA